MSLLRNAVNAPSRSVLVAVAAVALAAGFVVGAHSPWASTHVRTYEGVAIRANDEDDLGMFDADHGRTQATLSLGSSDIATRRTAEVGGDGSLRDCQA